MSQIKGMTLFVGITSHIDPIVSLPRLSFDHLTGSCGHFHICLSALGVHGTVKMFQVCALSPHLYAVRDFYSPALDAFLLKLRRSPPAARLRAHVRVRAHTLNLTLGVPAVRRMGAGDMTNGIVNIISFHFA